MTAWLLIAGITVCYFGLVGCAVAWLRLPPAPVDELAARRARRVPNPRVIFPPFDFEREEAGA